MMARQVALCVVLGTWCSGCRERPEAVRAEAGAPTPGGAELDAPLPPSKPVVCGTEECTAPSGSELLAPRACCVEGSGVCGVRSQWLGSQCASGTLPGTVDLHCPDVALPGGGALQGCCATDGRCGAFDRFGSMGCVTAPRRAQGRTPRVDGGEAGTECTPAVTECRQVVAMRCDGTEDCGPNEVCCGRSQRGLYDRFECAESCDALSDRESGLWFEICRAGDRCRHPEYECSGSDGLPGIPSRLGRCSVADTRLEGGAAIDGGRGTAGRGVACGNATCGASEQCCVPIPGAPYCAPLADACRCGGPRDASSAP